MASSLDYSLGPTLPLNQTEPTARTFDFTLTFENVVFTLVPNVVTLPLILYRIWLVCGQPKVVEWHAARVAKLVCLRFPCIVQCCLTD